jgi:hypothetical protein
VPYAFVVGAIGVVVTLDAPNKSNRNPPTSAPTIPSAMLSQKPWPCPSTILLPINPAIRPSMIHETIPKPLGVPPPSPIQPRFGRAQMTTSAQV